MVIDTGFKGRFAKRWQENKMGQSVFLCYTPHMEQARCTLGL